MDEEDIGRLADISDDVYGNNYFKVPSVITRVNEDGTQERKIEQVNETDMVKEIIIRREIYAQKRFNDLMYEVRSSENDLKSAIASHPDIELTKFPVELPREPDGLTNLDLLFLSNGEEFGGKYRELFFFTYNGVKGMRTSTHWVSLADIGRDPVNVITDFFIHDCPHTPMDDGLTFQYSGGFEWRPFLKIVMNNDELDTISTASFFVSSYGTEPLPSRTVLIAKHIRLRYAIIVNGEIYYRHRYPDARDITMAFSNVITHNNIVDDEFIIHAASMMRVQTTDFIHGVTETDGNLTFTRSGNIFAIGYIGEPGFAPVYNNNKRPITKWSNISFINFAAMFNISLAVDTDQRVKSLSDDLKVVSGLNPRTVYCYDYPFAKIGRRIYAGTLSNSYFPIVPFSKADEEKFGVRVPYNTALTVYEDDEENTFSSSSSSSSRSSSSRSSSSSSNTRERTRQYERGVRSHAVQEKKPSFAKYLKINGLPNTFTRDNAKIFAESPFGTAGKRRYLIDENRNVVAYTHRLRRDFRVLFPIERSMKGDIESLGLRYPKRLPYEVKYDTSEKYFKAVGLPEFYDEEIFNELGFTVEKTFVLNPLGVVVARIISGRVVPITLDDLEKAEKRGFENVIEELPYSKVREI